MGQSVREQILPFIALIESSIEKSHFVKKISDKCNISESAIWDDLKKVKIEPGVAGAEVKVTSGSKEEVALTKADSIGRRILGIINWQEKDADKIIDIAKTKEKVKPTPKNVKSLKWNPRIDQTILELF